MPYLIVREPGRVPFMTELGGNLTLGRDVDNDLVLSDARVSRHHARLETARGGFRVVDLGARHPTTVNEEGLGDELLRDQDVIRVGRVSLTFHDRIYAPWGAPTLRKLDADPPRAGAHANRLQVMRELGHA